MSQNDKAKLAKQISISIFDEVVPEICNQYKKKIDAEKPGPKLQSIAQEISKNIAEQFKPMEGEETPEYKVISHVSIMPKDDTSLFEGITCVWESGFDCYRDYKLDTQKYHIKVYECLLPVNYPK